MMFTFNADKRRERAASAAREAKDGADRIAKHAACPHRDWFVWASSWLGTATCDDCGATLQLYDCLNSMQARFNEAMAAREKAAS